MAKSPFLAFFALAVFGAGLAGCHGPAPASGPLLLAGSPAGTGSAQITVALPAAKAPAAQRSVQNVDFSRASYIQLYVAGAGINGWTQLTGNTGFGAPNASGIRTASYTSSVVPAGLRRIFRLDIYDGSNNLLEELWGVADITVGQTATLTLSGATTPVGQIFRKLVLAGNTSLALNLNVASVQSMVDALLNTNSATGAAIDGTKPQINWSLLNTDLAASAIANGQNGTPYTVPSPLPSYLVPTPVRQAQVTLKGVGVNGQPINDACVAFLNDQASKIQTTASGVAAVIDFPAVTPGSWTGTVVDTVTGAISTVGMTVNAGDSPSLTVMMPPSSIQRVVGAYDLDTNSTSGYNGEFNPPLLCALNSPCRVVSHNGVLYFVDVGNNRIRSVDMNSNQPIVHTVAGNGAVATSVAPEGSNANQVPLKIDGNCHLTFDQNGNLLFSEQGFNRIAKVDLTTGLLTTYVSESQITGIDTGHALGPIAFDQTTHTLYVGGVDWTLCTNLVGIAMDTFPAAGSCTQYSTVFAGGMVRSGNYLFFSTGYQGGYQVIRRNLTTGTNEVVVGKTQIYARGNGVPAQQAYISTNGGPGYANFTLDGLGNLYFVGIGAGNQIYRVTDVLNGTDASNDWTINNLGLNSAASGANGLFYDPAFGLFFSGQSSVANPNGSGSVSVAAINLLKP